jgi:DHA2 family methylenomycin A resistance protein-like MFS transporter
VQDSRRLVLVVMCVGYFLVLLDVTVVNVALPQIGEGLAAGVSSLQWVVDGYALALAALLLTGGTLGDLRGHRPVVLAGLGVFGAASLGCALAPGVGVLIAARVVQGIGAALLLPGTLAVIARAYPQPGEQARAIGVWAGVGSVALPAGPLLGGLLVQTAGWRWVFALNVPVVLVAGLVTARRVRADAPDRTGRRLDVAGTALAVGTLATATAAVIGEGRGSAVAAGLAAAGLVAFVVVERRAADPMLPLALFRRPAFAGANAVAGVMNFGTLGLLFLLTLFLQGPQHRPALGAGVAVLPLFLPLTVLAPVAGRWTARTGPWRVMGAGLLLAAVGVGLLAGWHPATPYRAVLPALLAWGTGLGLLTPAVVAAAVGAVPPDRAGLASGVNNTARQAGGVLGIAVYGALAGSPARAGSFVAGLHAAGLLTAGLYGLAALGAAAAAVARRRDDAAP